MYSSSVSGLRWCAGAGFFFFFMVFVFFASSAISFRPAMNNNIKY